MLNLKKFSQSANRNKILHPREIFNSLNKSVKFEYARDVQTEVWNKWYENRSNSHHIIKMNTGSGKTTVGLLILQSCLNESGGTAVYVVPDNYLKTQLINEADQLGVSVTENVEDVGFRSGNKILVANIFKIANGLSVFGTEDSGIKVPITHILIDDAHSCLKTIEDQFSIQLKRSENKDAFEALLNLFREDLRQQCESKLFELEHGDPSGLMEVPYWAWQSKQSEVIRILYPLKDDSIKFNYPLLKARLKNCRCVFSGGNVEISPEYIPIEALPSLDRATHKIFLTATLSDDTVLGTHFGLTPFANEKAITPELSSDIGDRMILQPQALNPQISSSEIREKCKEVSKNINVVVIVPSSESAKLWDKYASQTLDKENIEGGVEKLRREHCGLTVLINRFDGVDLPGDSCRLLVIDGIPKTRKLSNRIDETVVYGSEEYKRNILQKIEQGMGRGIRSSRDYCAVILMDKTLIGHVHSDFHYFSDGTKAQMELSREISGDLQGADINSIFEALNYCINQNPDWVALVKERSSNLRYSDDLKFHACGMMKAAAFRYSDHSQTSVARRELEKLCNTESDEMMKGQCKQLLAKVVNHEDTVLAQTIQMSAIKHNSRLQKPLEGIQYSKLQPSIRSQAESISRFLQSRHSNDINGMQIKLNSVLSELGFRPESSNRFEEAIKSVGLYLGFESQRPENEYNRGPDNLWGVSTDYFIVIECKNEAIADKVSKEYCNQINGSIVWFKEEYKPTPTYKALHIHPSNVYEYASTPDRDIRVMREIELDKFKGAVLELYKVIAKNGMNNIDAISQALKTHKLNKDQLHQSFSVLPTK